MIFQSIRPWQLLLIAVTVTAGLAATATRADWFDYPGQACGPIGPVARTSFYAPRTSFFRPFPGEGWWGHWRRPAYYPPMTVTAGCAPCASSCSPCGLGSCASGNCLSGSCGLTQANRQPIPDTPPAQPDPNTSQPEADSPPLDPDKIQAEPESTSEPPPDFEDSKFRPTDPSNSNETPLPDNFETPIEKDAPGIIDDREPAPTRDPAGTNTPGTDNPPDPATETPDAGFPPLPGAEGDAPTARRRTLKPAAVAEFDAPVRPTRLRERLIVRSVRPEQVTPTRLARNPASERADGIRTTPVRRAVLTTAAQR